MIKDLNFKDFALLKTPSTSDSWINLTTKERVEIIKAELKKKN